MKHIVLAMVLIVLACSASAQVAEPFLVGSWKYLRTFHYVHIDEQDRVFQCRISPDLHVVFSTGKYQEGGVIDWEVPRFFSLYGTEMPSGQVWGRNTMELRVRVMFLTVPTVSGQSTERLEFDKVPVLPTICAHYLAIAFE
ncbi:MAG: hypothetical protein Q8L60_06030 [Gammaproteobacteria bacterium]|nr:hypothetical protein [Gammaproteobacteria bacterium]MDP2140353.1 hypothetical protein [Gammaproteobacteria bacterium]MDP2346130.1 hypothetical protein [Gammaproteobacteria bacterium]